MQLTGRRLNRATLARQLLLDREDLPPALGLHRVVALQAQEPPSPYIALWNRLARFDPDALTQDFNTGTAVKASLMRITLHAVHVDDHRLFHQAMLPTLRASRLNDRRYRSTALTVEDADGALRDLMAFTRQPRDKDEIEAMLADRAGAETVEPWLWWALRTFAPLRRAPTGGPWAFEASPRYVAAAAGEAPATEAAIEGLLHRYLEGFGPASAADFAQFTLLRQAEIGPALERMAGSLVTHEGPDGETLYDVPGGELPGEEVSAPPRLLGMWDSILFAYRDRSRVLPDEHRPWVIRRNGDCLPTVLVDGHVAGVWRPQDDRIEVTAFERLDAATWDAIEAEAADLVGLLRRDRGTYGRYARWWSKLPDGDTRLLPSS